MTSSALEARVRRRLAKPRFSQQPDRLVKIRQNSPLYAEHGPYMLLAPNGMIKMSGITDLNRLLARINSGVWNLSELTPEYRAACTGRKSRARRQFDSELRETAGGRA